MNFDEIIKYYEELPSRIKNNPYFQIIEYIVDEKMRELLLEEKVNNFKTRGDG